MWVFVCVLWVCRDDGLMKGSAGGQERERTLYLHCLKSWGLLLSRLPMMELSCALLFAVNLEDLPSQNRAQEPNFPAINAL